MQATDVDLHSILVEMLQTSAFFMSMHAVDSIRMHLYNCLCYAIVQVYSNGIIVKEVCRQMPEFITHWSNYIKVRMLYVYKPVF
jgi:hypothetical protein